MSNAENVCPVSGSSGGAGPGAAAARELRRLAARPPPGVRLLLRDDDLSDLHALIDGPAETPYAGGVFRVRLALGREFPARAPRAYFVTRVFHPNVAWESGEVCVDTLRREWRADTGLERALLALRCLLIAPNADSALNADAAQLLRDDYARYAERARLFTEIHARPPPDAPDAPGAPDAPDAPSTSARAPPAKRARAPADARRVLKRL